MSDSTKKVVVTGANGLMGWHALVRLHAENCAAASKKQGLPYQIVALSKEAFNTDQQLEESLANADLVIHLAGINRAPEEVIAEGNPAIANRLVQGCKRVGVMPHIVYANSTHSESNSIYGVSKKAASDLLAGYTSKFTDFMFPHIFGECAKPFYNNVTATLIEQIIGCEAVTVNPDGHVSLLHAGDAMNMVIDAFSNGNYGVVRPPAQDITVTDLCSQLEKFHQLYQKSIYPFFETQFQLKLFNCYRAATFPQDWPRPLQIKADNRGHLFELVKGGSGGQTFFSSTKPGITRGNHFHLGKVERFAVVKGDAIIRLRKVFDDKVVEYSVSGDKPVIVDMPTMHCHSIENVGSEELLTTFWTHEIFDPQVPDTYADKVLVQ